MAADFILAPQGGSPYNRGMAWIWLLLAAVCEVGWPVGMKLASSGAGCRWLWIAFAVVTMALSGVFLYLAQKQRTAAAALRDVAPQFRADGAQACHLHLMW